MDKIETDWKLLRGKSCNWGISSVRLQLLGSEVFFILQLLLSAVAGSYLLNSAVAGRQLFLTYIRAGD